MSEYDPIQLDSESPDETFRIAATLGQSLRAPVVVTLSGPLGAGKTHFVRGLATGLGISPDKVSSPTFVLCQEYTGPDVTLIHIDAYRMRSSDDLDSIGWEELLRADNLIIAIEWPQGIADALPVDRIDIAIDPRGPMERAITVRRGTEEPVSATDDAGSTADVSPIACRVCGNELPSHGDDAPFCSKRCRMADLGRWFSGTYSISREIEEEDLWEQS